MENCSILVTVVSVGACYRGAYKLLRSIGRICYIISLGQLLAANLFHQSFKPKTFVNVVLKHGIFGCRAETLCVEDLLTSFIYMHCMCSCWYSSRNRNRNAHQLNTQSAATESNRSNVFAKLKLYLQRWIQVTGT